MSAVHRGLPARARSVALLVPLLTGLLLTSGPAVAAPDSPTSPPAAAARGAAGDEPVVTSTTTRAEAGSRAIGAVELAITVTAESGPVNAGFVTVAENGSTVADSLAVIDGVASYTDTGVAAGAHVYTVTYSGADGLGSSATTVPVEVQGRAPVTLTLSPSSPTAGAVSLAIGVAAAGGAALSGTVEVAEGSTVLAGALPVVDGQARFSITGVSTGRHTYTVTYSGDARTDVAVSTVDVAVRGETVLTVADTSSQVGGLRLTIGVSADGQDVSGGTVTISESGKAVKAPIAVSDGRAVWSATGLRPGHHAYAIEYSGTTGVEPAATVVDATVRDKAAAQLSVGSTSTSVGKLVLRVGITAAGAPVARGTIKVIEGSKTLQAGIKVVKGAAVWRATRLRSGRHTYTVRYSGTPTVKATSTRYVATVKAKVKPALALTATSTAPKKVRVAVRITATGQTRLGGSVKIKEGSRTRKTRIAVKAGKASWSATGVKPGKHTYTVAYSGTAQVKGGSAKVTVRVMKPVAIVDYANCTELNKRWPHGVGRPGAVDSVSGNTAPVTTFLRHAKLYSVNAESDRDKDGIACERL